MTSKKDILILYLLILIEILILMNSKNIVQNINNTSILFITKIFPSLFPTMAIGNMLVKLGINNIIPKIIKKIFNKLFHFDDNMTCIYIMSMFCGTPSNIMFINEYLDNGLINEKTAEYLCYTTHFFNPLFIISGVGIGIFNNIKIGIIILLMLYISSFIKLFVTRKKLIPLNKKILTKKENTLNAFSISVKQSINAILIIFGIIILFNILNSLIKEIFNLNYITSIFINSLLEVTSGITKLNMLNIPIILKIILTYILLSFGGLCIHMQVFSINKNKKIRYFKYLIFRINFLLEKLKISHYFYHIH